MQNKTIKIFISSSSELSEERKSLAAFASEINNMWNDKGIVVIPVEWEFVEAGLNGGSKQEEYIRALDECERCVVMFHTKVGMYTEQELRHALERAGAKEKPYHVNVLFKYDDEKELEKYPEVKRVHDELMGKKMFHESTRRYNSFETLRLRFLTYIQFELKPYFPDFHLKIEDGKAMIGDKVYVELENLNSFKNSEEYKGLTEQIADLEELLVATTDEVKRLQRSAKLQELRDRKAKMEKDIWDVTLDLTRISNERCTERLKRAIELMEAGDYRGADALLKEEAIDSDVRDKQRKIEMGRQAEVGLMENIREYKTKIDIAKIRMEKGWVENVIGLYDKCIKAARGYVGKEELAELLFEYAHFLQDEKQFHLSEGLYEEVLVAYRELEEINPATYRTYLATTLNNLALLHKDTNRYEEAEKEYNEALGIYRELAEINPAAYCPDVAMTLNNIALLHNDTNKYEEAEKEYNEALGIYRELAEINPAAYRSYVAMALNNISLLHSNTRRYEDSEKEYTEALSMYRELAEINPAAYRPDVAMTLNNIALLHNDTNKYEEAEKEYTETLGIYRELTEINPAAYRFHVAMTLNNIAKLHMYINRYEEAEKGFREALCVCRELAEINPAAYRFHVAMTLNNIALLHSNTGRFEEAEKEYIEALGIYRELAKVSPAAHRSYLAITLNNIALLHSNTGRFEEAEKEYGDALEIRRGLAEISPAAYRSDVAETLINIALQHWRTNRYEEVEKEIREVLLIYRELATVVLRGINIFPLMNLLAYALFYQKKSDEALAQTDELISMDGGNPEWYCSRGEILLAMDRTDEALAMWNKVLELNPDFGTNSELYKGLLMRGLV